MGFENRKAARIPFSANLCYWSDGGVAEAAVWAHAENLSESGMAFQSDFGLEKKAIILLEFAIPGFQKALRMFGEVVQCQDVLGKGRRKQIRVKFLNLESDEMQKIQRHVLQIARPKLAAVMGWGKAHFHGRSGITTNYRELSAAEQKKFFEGRHYISMREAAFLRNFQLYLEESLGSRSPGNFRLYSGHDLKKHAPVWLEMSLSSGVLHGLAEVMWTQREAEGSYECGLVLNAFHKDEAIKLEKEGKPLPPLT
jgi:hypothetical protein